ncbi:unnamed protein product [Boreogadus saida]
MAMSCRCRRSARYVDDAVDAPAPPRLLISPCAATTTSPDSPDPEPPHRRTYGFDNGAAAHWGTEGARQEDLRDRLDSPKLPCLAGT